MTSRPTSADYIYSIFTDFTELHGDRRFGDDKAVIGGIAWLEDIPVTVIGIEKGHDTAERMERSFGAPEPEGYRKALRLMRQAEKFKRPVITFVDTSGAYCGIELNDEYCCWALKRLETARELPRIQGYADGVFWERNSDPERRRIRKNLRSREKNADA